MEEGIAAHLTVQAWSRNTIEQVRTAIRLFDFACGGDIEIENITKAHILAFKRLCADLPNRWVQDQGRAEAGGLRASLERAKTMDPSKLGMRSVHDQQTPDMDYYHHRVRGTGRKRQP